MPQGTFNDIIKKHFSTKIFLIGIIFSAVTMVIEKLSNRFSILVYQLDFGIPNWVSPIYEVVSFISFALLFIGLFIFRRHCLGLSEKDGLLLVAITSIINVAVSIEKSILLFYGGINYASIVSLIPLSLQTAITIGIISGIIDYKWGKNPQRTADALIFALFCKVVFTAVLFIIGFLSTCALFYAFILQLIFSLLAGTHPMEETSRKIYLHVINILLSPTTFVSAVMYLSVLFRIKNDIKKLDKAEE